MTPIREEISRLKAICDAAAKGPWLYDCGNGQVESANRDEYRKPICERVNTWDINTTGKLGELIDDAEETCEFIAESRTALPAALEALEVALDALENMLNMSPREQALKGICQMSVARIEEIMGKR